MGSPMPLRYVEYGRGDAPVILLHGLFGAPDNWREIMEVADGLLFAPSPLTTRPQSPEIHREQLTDCVGSSSASWTGQAAIPGRPGGDYLRPCCRPPDHHGQCGLFGAERREAAPESEIIHRRSTVSTSLFSPIVDDVHVDRRYVRFLTVAKASGTPHEDELDQLTMPTLIIWEGRQSRRRLWRGVQGIPMAARLLDRAPADRTAQAIRPRDARISGGFRAGTAPRLRGGPPLSPSPSEPAAAPRAARGGPALRDGLPLSRFRGLRSALAE